MRAGAQRPPDVVAQRADIRPPAAVHVDQEAIFARLRDVIDGVDAHRARGNGHVLPRPRRLIQLAPVHLDGGVHRRHLLDVAYELRQHGEELRLAHARPALDHRARRVLRVRRRAHAHLRAVGLFLVADVVEQPRGRADADGQHARRLGVERAHVAHLRALGQSLAHHHHRVRGRHARGLEQIQKSVRHFTAFASADPMTAPASSMVLPTKLQPAARTCPPPPNFTATCATS